MKKIGGLIILLFCTVMVFSQPDKAEVETVEGKKYYIHFVQKGQTLYAIHQLYDVPVGDIALAQADPPTGVSGSRRFSRPAGGACWKAH